MPDFQYVRSCRVSVDVRSGLRRGNSWTHLGIGNNNNGFLRRLDTVQTLRPRDPLVAIDPGPDDGPRVLLRFSLDPRLPPLRELLHIQQRRWEACSEFLGAQDDEANERGVIRGAHDIYVRLTVEFRHGCELSCPEPLDDEVEPGAGREGGRGEKKGRGGREGVIFEDKDGGFGWE